MNHLIERYVHDVVRRLPEKDRDEVRRELNSNIYDMLPDDADESEIKAILYKLGAPASLAEKYRQNPRYLISPAVYDDYVRLLKWVLPLVGVVVLVVGMVLGAIDAIQSGMADVSYVISKTLSNGISMGVSAAFQALVWITAGFAIAERTGAKANKDQEWKIEDLPEVLPKNKDQIPLSDSIAELVLTSAFSVLAILACSGILPIAFMFQYGETQIRTLFSSGFLASCIPAIAVTALCGICECVIKIKERRWTSLVCGAVLVSHLTTMGITVYLINRPDLFSAEFTAFLQSIDWGRFDLLRFMGTGGIRPIIIFISIVIVVCSLAECGHAIYRTFKNRDPQEL